MNPQVTGHLTQQPPQQSDSQPANSHLETSKRLILELFRSGTAPEVQKLDEMAVGCCLSWDSGCPVRQMGTNKERTM